MKVETQFRNDEHGLSPWLMLNIVFFVLVRVIHLFFMISDNRIIATPYSLSRRHMNEAEYLAYLHLPNMMMVSACLFFVVTLFGEMADGGRIFRGEISSRTFYSLAFSVLSLAYSMSASLHLYTLYPTIGK